MSCLGTFPLVTRMSPCTRERDPRKFFPYSSRSSSSISDANTHSCPKLASARWKPPMPAKRSTYLRVRLRWRFYDKESLCSRAWTERLVDKSSSDWIVRHQLLRRVRRQGPIGLRL